MKVAVAQMQNGCIRQQYHQQKSVCASASLAGSASMINGESGHWVVAYQRADVFYSGLKHVRQRMGHCRNTGSLHTDLE